MSKTVKFKEADYFHTLEEIGQELGVTRERVRQILVVALEKFKAGMLLKAIKLSNFV